MQSDHVYYGVALDEFISRHSEAEIFASSSLNDRWVFARRVKECEAMAEVGFFERDEAEERRMRQGEFSISRNHFKLFATNADYRAWYLTKYPHDPVYQGFRAIIPGDELAMGPVIGIHSGTIALNIAKQLESQAKRREAMKMAIFGAKPCETQKCSTEKKAKSTIKKRTKKH